MIPPQYLPRLLTESEKEGYFNWSLNFFTDTNTLQVPCVDLTIQLDVTKAYQLYQLHKGATFFSFLIWHLLQTLKTHLSFNLRQVEDQWYILDNPPVMIPVAVGGKERFWEMVLFDSYNQSYSEFINQYCTQLDHIRKGKGKRADSSTFSLACFCGNLPNLQFTGLTLHWHSSGMIGQPFFYFGQRYWQEERLLIPLAVKLHHACQDPFVFDLLIQDFLTRF